MPMRTEDRSKLLPSAAEQGRGDGVSGRSRTLAAEPEPARKLWLYIGLMRQL